MLFNFLLRFYHFLFIWHKTNTLQYNFISAPSGRTIAIVVGTIGSLLFLLALAALVYCFYRKPLKKEIITSTVPGPMAGNENENDNENADPRNVSEVMGCRKI